MQLFFSSKVAVDSHNVRHNQAANMQNQAATVEETSAIQNEDRAGCCVFRSQLSLFPPLPVQGIVFGIVWH